MRNSSMILTGRAFVAVLAFTLANAPVLANKPDWSGGFKTIKNDKDKGDNEYGKGGKHSNKDKDDKRNDERRDARVGSYFVEHDRVVVQQYYQQGKRCPPGLAKKNNGCMPPGQAKKMYVVGQPLPNTVVYSPVPQAVLVKLPPPPPQHRYVGVAGDILLLAIGTSMVVDALGNLTR